jgi:hypothetical protein
MWYHGSRAEEFVPQIQELFLPYRETLKHHTTKRMKEWSYTPFLSFVLGGGEWQPHAPAALHPGKLLPFSIG